MKNTLHTLSPAGYLYLEKILEFDVISHWHRSYISSGSKFQTAERLGIIEDTYPATYWPGDTIGAHLEFALKYDGINLGYLATIFKHINTADLINYINSKPSGKYARRIWFLYEFLTDDILPIPSLTKGNYINVLDPKDNFVISPGKHIQRQRVIDNLLGDKNFCPIVRRTQKLVAAEKNDIRTQCEKIITSYPQRLLKRALNYLYHKETKSSFEIENIKPSSIKTERFIALLKQADRTDFMNENLLIELQNQIVDPRFKETSYRNNQNYVGQTISHQTEIIHYVCPRPETVSELMHGLFSAHERMQTTDFSPIVHAATISYGFVFLHPFEDGNGRIHRFLIHNILAMNKLIPNTFILPISSVMLNESLAYDKSLEAFSAPLVNLIDYSLDNIGRMTVNNDNTDWYRYIDMTAQVEALYHFVSMTIDDVLVNELTFLNCHDNACKAIQEIIDMPDHLTDRFIQFCLRNDGKLSARKRKSYYEFLTDDELIDMEQAVQSSFHLNNNE